MVTSWLENRVALLEESVQKVEGRFPKNSRQSTMQGHVHPGITVIDHGTIPGLLDDDHTQYALATGRYFSLGVDGRLSNELSIRESDASTIDAGVDLLMKWAEAARRDFQIENLTSLGGVAYKATGPTTGETGTATSTTTTQVNDTTKAWAVSQWVHATVVIGGQTRLVTASTATQLTVSPAFSPSPGAVAYTINHLAVLEGYVGTQTQPRVRVSRDDIQWGVGTVAPDAILRRTGTRAMRLISNSPALMTTLGGMTSTDAQPKWLMDSVIDPTLDYPIGAPVGRMLFGRGGTTAPDTGIRRGPDAGYLFMPDVLMLTNIVTPPTPSASVEASPPGYLYARNPTGTLGGAARLFFYDGSGDVEIGPIGTLRGLLKRLNTQLGGFALSNADAGSFNGLNFWGIMAGATQVGTATSANAAYSPALSLTNNIAATDNVFDITGGLPLKGDTIVIGTEKIQVIQDDGVNSVIHCLRGAYATTPAAHLAGAAISLAGGAPQPVIGSDGEAAFEGTTGTVSGTDTGIQWPRNHTLHAAALLVYKFDLRNVTNLRMFIGFTDQTLATMNAGDNPGGHYWGIQFSTARGDTEFKAVSKDGPGGTQNVQATGWGAPVAGAKYYIVLDFGGAGDPLATLFAMDWAQIGDPVPITAFLPSLDSALLRLCAGIRNTTAADKRIRHILGSMNLSPSVA